jgi:hypothetical protein
MDFKEANSAVTGGPGVIELGGTTYLVGQPDDRVFAAVAQRLKERAKAAPTPLQSIIADLPNLSPEDRATAIKAAVECQVGRKEAPITDAFAQEQLMTPDGAGFLAWLLIRKEQPDAKYETIKPLVTDENYMDVLARLMTASGLEAVAKKKVGTNGSSHGPPPTA